MDIILSNVINQKLNTIVIIKKILIMSSKN